MSQALTPYHRTDEPDARATEADDDAYSGDLDAQHDRCVRWFEESERASLDARTEAERARDYYSGFQWTAAEQAALKKRGQPELTINYVRRKVDLLCGLERKARTDPKAFSHNPASDDESDAATQALRYVADDTDFSLTRSAVYENMLVEGFGGVELGLIDDGKSGADITITHVSWERIWYDPHSRDRHFEDARYKGLVIWMDRDQLEETYPDAEDIVADSFAPHASSYDDRPSTVAWTDNQRQRVRVVQCYWSEQGAWWGATFTRHGFLTEPAKSPFKDKRGKSCCQLILQSAYVDRENRRYGIVRDLFSLQDELNKRRSKALHLLSVHQVVAEKGAVSDVDKARREVARPDGYVEIMPGMKFEITPGGDLAAGQFQLLKHATEEMQASGPNASMSGTDPREMSGRAILAQQAGGAAQNEPLADALRMWSRRVYETCWMAAREYWAAGKWVRVTDDLNETKWVGINRRVTLQDELANLPDQQRAMMMQRLQLMPGDPRLHQVIRVENDITDMDVDITIEEGIDIPSIQAEQFQTLVQLAGIQPGLIPGDVLIAASGLKNKDQLLERMKQHQEQMQQQQAKQAPLIEAHAQAQVAESQSKAAANFALAKERQHNTVRGVHDMHAEFAAPPYGQPFAAPPDPPSAPGAASGPAMMASHASGGLVTRTLPAETWRSQLPGTYVDRNGVPQVIQGAPNFHAINPEGFSSDNLEMTYPGFGANDLMPPQSWAGPPRSHATGGPVTQLSGGNPPGPDDGYITAKPGEYVVQQSAVARYGPDLLNAINAGQIDPKVLTMAAAHAEADLRAKNAKASLDEMKAGHTLHQAVNTIADTHLIHHTINNPPPAPSG